MRRKLRNSSRIAQARRAKRVETGLYISENYWLTYRPYHSFKKTDPFYFSVANEVYLALQKEKDFILGDVMLNHYTHILACILTSYFEDKMSDLGMWNAFIERNKELYGFALPFYNLDNYDEKGMNVQDIQYLIWHRMSKDKEILVAPEVENICDLGKVILSIFKKNQAKAKPNVALKKYFSLKDGIDLYEMRHKLQWIALNSYVLGPDLGVEFGETLEKYDNEDHPLFKNRAYISYMTLEDFGYSERSSFAALSAPEFISRIIDASDELKASIKNLKRRMGFYQYKGKERNHRLFQHGQTLRTYRVVNESVQENEAQPLTNGQIFQMSLIQWQGEWWMTGMMSGGVFDESVLKQERAKPLSDKSFWTDEHKQTVIDQNQEQYEVFMETFGKQLVFYTSKKAYGEGMKLFYQNLRKRTEKVTVLSQEHKDQIEDLTDTMLEQLNHEYFCTFFNKKTGLQILFGIQEIVDLMELKNPTQDETGELFDFFTQGDLTMEFFEYLLEHYPADNLQFPLINYAFDVPKYLHFLRRFCHPYEFSPPNQLPNIALVDY